MEQPDITLSVRQLLFQAARHLGTSQPLATVPAITTVRDVVCAASTSLTDAEDVTPVILLPEGTGRLVRQVYRRLEAHERGLEDTLGSPFLRVRSLNEGPLSDIGNLPSPTARSRARMERLRGIAAGVIDKDPYFTTRTAIHELTLAALPHALLRLQGDESPADAPTCVISGRDTPVVWGTGNHLTTISIDAISSDFRNYLLSPNHESKAGAETITVEASLRFTNADVVVSFPARVGSHLPNGFSGVLLGQVGLIDSLVVKQIPRAFLQAEGEAVGDDIWGDLVVEKYMTPDGDIQEV